ncbi:MAG: GGDEF domain-containing protein, partial [Bacillota bacterium]
MNNTTNFTDLLEIGVKTADILIYHEDNNLIYEKASKFLYHQLEGFISQIRFYVTDKHGENFQEEVIYGERGWRPGYDFIPYYQLPGIIRKKKGFFRFNDDTHNYVLVPLVTAGQVLGLLEFQSVEEISDKIVEGLRQMSDTIALGISHNIFKENTIKSKKNTDVSIQINHKLQSITDLSELISYFMKLSVKYFKFDRITIFIFDNKNEIAFGRGIRENGGEFIVNEYPELPDLSKNTMPLKNGMGYWFPLKTNTGIVGMALFDNIYTQYEISTTLLDSLRILCSQFASAIDNIRLFSDLETSAFIDPLTGLYNRAYLEKIIPDFNQDDYLPLSVIIGDVNGLKITNDVFGHNAGDELLTRIAEIIQHSCRKEDLVIRWGGDEYVVFLPNTQQETADKICWKIKNACLDQTDTKVQLSISLGYATRYSMDDNLKSVMKEAEDRMYRHKLLETRNFRSSLMESLKATLVEKCYEPA